MDNNASHLPPRYGLTHECWEEMTPEERVIHYNRQNICEHKADINSWPEPLRESYSWDPYFHTAHMMEPANVKLAN